MLIDRRFQRLNVESYEHGPDRPKFCITYCNELCSPDNIKIILTLEEATELAIALDAAYTRAMRLYPHLRLLRPTLTSKPAVDQTEPPSLAWDQDKGTQRE